MKLSFFFLVLSVVALPLRAGFSHVQGTDIIGTDGQVLHIKGTNLGNWLEPEGYMWRLDDGPGSTSEIEAVVQQLLGPDKAAAFWHDYRERYTTQADIAFIAATGSNTIRVPLHYKFFLDEKSEGFRLLDRVVTWSKAAKLNVILDLHCAPGGQTGTNIDDSQGWPWLFESPGAQEQLLLVWRNLARHYREEPAVLGYDLLNEPLPNFKGWEKFPPLLEPLLRRVTEAVRKEDPHHIVFLTGANWDSDFKVLGAPFTGNLAYTFHKYWVPAEEDAIREYLEFRDKYHVPVWLGESGENDNAWITKFRTLLDSHDIGWTFWPYKKMDSDKGFVWFAKPVHWEKVVRYAQLSNSTHSEKVKAAIAARPTDAEITETFADFLRLIDLAHCEVSRGYIEALGLKVPAKK